MSRCAVLALLLTAAACAGTAGAQAPASSPPAPTPPAPTPQAAAADDLPVTRVVLFTSGVGYFEFDGTVTGTQERTLPVAADRMDDLLQSLVVQDLDGGTVRPVRYPSRDPLARILRSYRLDLSNDPTLAGLLSQARGEAVHVAAGQAIDGTIVNVERVEVAGAAPETYLTLATGTGLRRVSLAEVSAVRFADPAVQRDLDAALSALAQGRGADRRDVTLRFEGQGERRVRVGYVQAMPVWKTSYRLVLNGDGSADLQGWAIVDNPTDTDLRDVAMAFVAGRPVSFVTDLYDPIYLDRPHVALDFGPSVVPPAQSGQIAPSAKAADRAPFAPAPSARAESAAGAAPGAPTAPQLSGTGVEAMAQGAQTGATFTYSVGQPVTVLRHESAMIPIVLSTVPERPLSLFDPTVLTTHPLESVRVSNDSGLHLAAGPVTVFDRGGFAGDARMGDVVPGDARVLSYAVDLGTSVTMTGSGEPERVSAVSLQHGVVQATYKQRLRTRYDIDVKDGRPRLVVIDHAKRSGYEVVSPKPAPAQTPSAFRFAVAVHAADGTAPAAVDGIPVQARCQVGASCSLEVTMERTLSRSVAVDNVSPDDIAFYLANVELSADDRATLARVLDLKRQLADLARRTSAAQAQVNAIFQDQSRIRQNMSALDRNSSLYQRYATDLEAQENQLQDLRGQIDDLRGRQTALQGTLDDLLGGLGGP